MGWTKATLLLGAWPVQAGQGDAAGAAKQTAGECAAERADVEGFRSAGIGVAARAIIGRSAVPTLIPGCAHGRASYQRNPEHPDGYRVPERSV